MKWCTFLIAFLILVVPLDGRASDPGVVVRSCQVMSEPFEDARGVISFKAGDALDIIKIPAASIGDLYSEW